MLKLDKPLFLGLVVLSVVLVGCVGQSVEWSGIKTCSNFSSFACRDFTLPSGQDGQTVTGTITLENALGQEISAPAPDSLCSTGLVEGKNVTVRPAEAFSCKFEFKTAAKGTLTDEIPVTLIVVDAKSGTQYADSGFVKGNTE